MMPVESAIARFRRDLTLGTMLKALLAFLKSDPARKLETRKQRDEWVYGLVDAFLQFSAELRSLPARRTSRSARPFSRASVTPSL